MGGVSFARYSPSASLAHRDEARACLLRCQVVQLIMYHSIKFAGSKNAHQGNNTTDAYSPPRHHGWQRRVQQF